MSLPSTILTTVVPKRPAEVAGGSEPRVGRAPRDLGEVESAMRSFSEISSSLLASYNALELRAQHVEEKLAVANRALEAKVAELDAVLGALPVGVVVRDASGHITRANAALSRTVGCAEAGIVGRREVPALTRAQHADGHVELEDGSKLVLDLCRSEVTTSSGEALGSVEIVHDRTEITELTERLHAMDKVAALGTMAGGIAHEIRNPLNAVAGFAELLRMRLADDETCDPKVLRWSDLIVRGAGEVNGIISSLMTISSPERLERSRIEPGQLIEEAVEAARLGNDPGAKSAPVMVHIDCPEFVGDHIKLRQALRNLVANAMQAAPGRELHISAHQDEHEVVLAVADGGPGISADLRRRMLDPFFTTRAAGTGLGLSLAQTIADLHGGHLEIHTTPSELGGALIALHLPTAQA